MSCSRSEEIGVVRVSIDSDSNSAEFAISVRSDLKGHGIGRVSVVCGQWCLFCDIAYPCLLMPSSLYHSSFKALMEKAIKYCRSRLVSRLLGYILTENTPMLSLCKRLGFIFHRSLEDDMVRVELNLGVDCPTNHLFFYS